MEMAEIGKKIVAHVDIIQDRLMELVEGRQEILREIKRLDSEITQLKQKRGREEHVGKELETAKIRLKRFEEFEEAFMKLLGPLTIDAARKLVKAELAGSSSIDLERVKKFVTDMVQEELSKTPPSSSVTTVEGIPAEQLREEIRREVRTIVQATPNIVMVEPKGRLVKAVLKKEVEGVKAAVEKLPTQTRLMLGYLAASSKPAKFRELMIRYVGSDGGGQREQYLYPLRNLPSMVDYDSNHGTIRYVWRERMKEAYPDLKDDELDAAMSQVHAVLAANLASTA